MNNEKQFAVVESGGKQYTVSPGMTVSVDLMETEVGTSVKLDKVLLLKSGDKTKVGAPFVTGASVEGTVVGHEKQAKVLIFKKRRRKGYTKKQGHRQKMTEVLVQKINE